MRIYECNDRKFSWGNVQKMKFKFATDQQYPLIGSGLPRSPGLHITDVIRRYGIENQLLTDYDNQPNPSIEWNLPALSEVGFIWEDIVSHFAGKHAGRRPPEITYKGVSASPDGIFTIDGIMRLDEFKSSWSSPTKLLEQLENGGQGEKWWYYFTQSKCYMKMLQLVLGKLVTQVRYYFLFPAGKHRPGNPVIWDPLDVTFQPWEINETWEEIWPIAELILFEREEEL